METFDTICQVMTCHRGKQAAITLAELAERVKTSRRDVEQIIEQRLLDFPWPIVACSTGLYIPQEAADINQYLHNLHSRHRRMQIREATVRRKARLAGWSEVSGLFHNRPKQQELFA